MTPSKRVALGWWIAGLVAFGIVIWLGMPLAIETVPGGILDHQHAPDAEAVNRIQHAWRDAGLLGTARNAMIGDLVFIGIFGIGCVLCGLHYRAREQVVLRALGWTALMAGLIFLVADYGETISQLVQLVRIDGDDDLATIASGLRPIKVAAWIGGFLAVLLALIVERLSSRAS